jgi:hypothetical protein
MEDAQRNERRYLYGEWRQRRREKHDPLGLSFVLPSIIRASKNFATELIRMMQTGVTPLSSLTHLGENIWQIELNFTNYLVSSDLEWKA